MKPEHRLRKLEKALGGGTATVEELKRAQHWLDLNALAGGPKRRAQDLRIEEVRRYAKLTLEDVLAEANRILDRERANSGVAQAGLESANSQALSDSTHV